MGLECGDEQGAVEAEWIGLLAPVLDALDHIASIHDSRGEVRFQNVRGIEACGNVIGVPYAQQKRWAVEGDHLCVDGPIARALRQNRPAAQVVRVAHRDTNEEMWMSVVATPIEGPDGNRWAVLYAHPVAQIDIDELIAARQEVDTLRSVVKAVHALSA